MARDARLRRDQADRRSGGGSGTADAARERPQLNAAVVLFTRDLRVHDHAGLDSAAREHDLVLPLFVFDDRLLARAGPARRGFLHAALADLRASLRAAGADLIVRHGDPVAETVRLARAHDATAVCLADDASAYAQRRRRELEAAGLDVRRHDGIAAVPPGALTPDGRDHYRVFTPYWRRWREEPTAAVLAPPRRLALPHGVDAGQLPREDGTGGERDARRRLTAWLAGGLHGYDAGRDVPAADATSHLSPYLHFGCLSANEVVARARGEGPVADEFVRQLCWRDFYLQLLAANPKLETDDLHPREREWRDDRHALDRWREGETGVAIVDAAMRQLRAEGWLGNRARLIVAGYLTKTLELDWRHGAALFAELLVDADVANNVGNWQWVAGTGVDTRPHRGFSVDRQAKRFDPEGAYVSAYA
ncbi:MAG TPA: deoxyribodipyrimidine photo-lyase [Gaiellaceae bacterium]|nr:deoxyribodipyrimidine photo-lyase [Gaiellaceae bacterium]